jgi:hypothetical protein
VVVRLGLLLLLVAAVGAEDDRAHHPVKDAALRAAIDKAISKGVVWLEKTQHAEGYWAGPEDPKAFLKGGDHSVTAGYTCLALYALASSGVGADAPSITRGIAWLDANPKFLDGGCATATYTLSLYVLALTRIDPAAHRERIHRAAAVLLRGQQSDGMWTYTCGGTGTSAPPRGGDRAEWRKGVGPEGIPDNSNTQFGVLALWAAQSMAGFDVPERAWGKLVKHYRKMQEDDGGWPYRKVKYVSSATMTAAGTVSLTYALTSVRGGGEAAAAQARVDPAVRRGLRLLPLTPDAKWPLRRGRGGALWSNYYWIYSLERVGTVLGLDPETWYVPGARHLVALQNDDGSWLAGVRAARPKRTGSPLPYDTSLALLFLTRGTLPPIRGVRTERFPEREAPVTPAEALPDVKTPEGLARAFALYHEAQPG